MNDKTVIVRIDGGICSQIAFWAYGLELGKKGYDVEYDISWFSQNGMDCNKVFSRNFDLQSAFPKCELKLAIDSEKPIFQKLFYTEGLDLCHCHAPTYIGGYPARAQALWNNRLYLQENFQHIELDSKNREFVHEFQMIQESGMASCAVHVRRGDLSVYNPAYGYPADEAYYINAIKFISAVCNRKVKFFFFSEEPNWIEEKIVPELRDVEYKICTQNDSAKGYIDLYLMSQCEHIIASHGSFGFFAKLLSQKEGGYYISYGAKALGEDVSPFLSKFNNAVVFCRDETFNYNTQKRNYAFKKVTKDLLKKILAKVYILKLKISH